ncbi:hypothetical protein C1645_841596 [Glomus cerebriforme]|uniref:ATPase AAA-type core domain-containing protein n=1 Tax=Glomus cerebriforme TaxID=658196 RepID=A0A397S8K9_9GLOM|nr:hypothetical protein C1645_841596 [Glomus cerebriforme]
MTIIEQLTAKKDKIQEEHGVLVHASIRKNLLKNKLDSLDELISIYNNFQNGSPPNLSLTEVEEALRLTDASLLTGNEEGIGLLTNALLKTKSVSSLFLLDEIDKASERVQNSLLNILDSTQNTAIFNHYLDVNLDFSPITFIATANKLENIPLPLRKRMKIIELTPYTSEQKKAIAQKIIQK